MKVGIIGGGASGLFAALFLAHNHPDWQIKIFEKEVKAARKLLATGNGHCNILPSSFSAAAYSTDAVEPLIKEFPVEKIVSILEECGIYVSDRGWGYYPLSYSAKAFVDTLIMKVSKDKVLYIAGPAMKVADYRRVGNRYEIQIQGGSAEIFDKIIIATGGFSSPNLGSDGSFASVLRKHGYKMQEPMPSLCPVKVKEKGLGPLKGLRHSAKVTLEIGGREVYREDGEVLFKNDGLSGIAVFNCSAHLAWKSGYGKSKIHVDLFPEIKLEKLEKMLSRKGLELTSVFELALANYLSARAKEENKSLAQLSKDLTFSPVAPYSFMDSQVTHGGIEMKEVSSNFESRKEPGVYIVGEALNVDALCGGFNLGWCLMSALKVAKTLN